MDATTVIRVCVAALGAVAQELVYWYDLRTKLAAAKYRALMNSAGYWVITVTMIIVAALCTAVWFAGEQQTLRTYLIMGAAFPLVLKKAVSAFLAKNVLGARDTARAYFREQ
jgi:ABC-type molybdate transport system permease subunit